MDIQVDDEKIAEFTELLKSNTNVRAKELLKGIATKIDDKYVFIDVGIKSEGRIAKEEFTTMPNSEMPKVGDELTVWLDAYEDKNGEVSLSYSKAIRETSWSHLEEMFHKRVTVVGKVTRKVQSGCIMSVAGVSAFLPKANFLPTKQDPKIGSEFECVIVRMDRIKSQITVSSNLSSESIENTSNFSEGQIVQGTVKTLTESFASIDISGVIGRLHISEMSWNRLKEPSDVLKVGEKIDVKILSISPSNRISLSIKELQENPWMTEIKKAGLQEGMTCSATVKNTEENYAILEINKIETRMKASETSWERKRQTLSNLKKNQEIIVKIIEIDGKKNKIFASIRQLQEHPIVNFANHYKVGDEVACTILKTTENGYLAEIGDTIEATIAQDAVIDQLRPGQEYKMFVSGISMENKSVTLAARKL